MFIYDLFSLSVSVSLAKGELLVRLSPNLFAFFYFHFFCTGNVVVTLTHTYVRSVFHFNDFCFWVLLVPHYRTLFTLRLKIVCFVMDLNIKSVLLAHFKIFKMLADDDDGTYVGHNP